MVTGGSGTWLGKAFLQRWHLKRSWSDERKQQCESLRVLHLRPTTQHTHKLQCGKRLMRSKSRKKPMWPSCDPTDANMERVGSIRVVDPVTSCLLDIGKKFGLFVRAVIGGIGSEEYGIIYFFKSPLWYWGKLVYEVQSRRRKTTVLWGLINPASHAPRSSLSFFLDIDCRTFPSFSEAMGNAYHWNVRKITSLGRSP